MPDEVTISVAELSKHNSRNDCWVAVHSSVWDLTDFVDEHPGGAEVLIRVAGRNATAEFDEVHAPGLLEENLPADKLKGKFTDAMAQNDDKPPPPAPAPVPQAAPPAESKAESVSLSLVPSQPPPLLSVISGADFEQVASRVLTAKTWAFYSSAATDLNSHQQNKSYLRRIKVQPRVLRNVSSIQHRRSILGHDMSAPIFISPAAMARLAHPDGELALARAAKSENIIQCISSNAAFPLSKIVEAGGPGQPVFLQLYVNKDRPKTEELLRKARSMDNVRAVFVTVDAPVAGKREADERVAVQGQVQAAISGAAAATNDKRGGGLGRLMGGYIDSALTWADLAWIRQCVTDESGKRIPIVIKGVQSVEDARLAVEYGADGILVSNHGGRSLDTSQPSILTLLELRQRCPQVFGQLEVYIDGGFDRGLDILKALALGATAVGIGRPYLYSLVYGQEGAEHLTQILKDEIDVSMRMLGVTSLDQLTPEFLNTAELDPLLRDLSKFPPLPTGRLVAAKL